MLADLPATRAQVARHLGISLSTLTKYAKADQAPHAVMLALFWETRWGRSAADVEASNFGATYYREAKGLERELQRMAGVMLRLEQEIDFHSRTARGAANSPVWRTG